MKKIISVFLSLLLLTAALAFPAGAAKQTLPTSAGAAALRNQFASGNSPAVNGISLDYKYYSPVGANDRTKYPIVIFLHGIGHGSYVGSQLADSDMAYWASSELQSRFSAGGAFIIMPRCPENKVEFWGESYIEPLRVMIDDFIRNHKANVDTTRIAVSGSSQGGAMCWMLVEAYPEYFSAAFPIASTESPTVFDLRATSNVAVWLIASKLDPVINYPLITLPLWNNIRQYNAHPENCRLSSFGTVYNPDGTRSSDNHHLAGVITYDLHMLNGSNYAGLETVNGLGQTVDITAPNGLIRWISSVHSDFRGPQNLEASSVNPIARVIEIIRNFFLEIVHLFQKIFGL